VCLCESWIFCQTSCLRDASLFGEDDASLFGEDVVILFGEDDVILFGEDDAKLNLCG